MSREYRCPHAECGRRFRADELTADGLAPTHDFPPPCLCPGSCEPLDVILGPGAVGVGE